MSKLNKWLPLISIIIGGIFLFGTNQAVSASTDSTTPIEPWRYGKKTANYHDNSTSSYYKTVWNNATSKWRTDGFNWTKVSAKSKTVVTSYSDSSKTGLNTTGVTHTQYNASGFIVSNKVTINRAAFKKYNYSQAQRTYVAEHELGHALGLAHNKIGSKSVMNPANRYYTIEKCDINGMNKRYSIAFNSDVVDPTVVYTVDTYEKVGPNLAIQDIFN